MQIRPVYFETHRTVSQDFTEFPKAQFSILRCTQTTEDNSKLSNVQHCMSHSFNVLRRLPFCRVRAPRASWRTSGQCLWRPASSLIQSFTCTCFLFFPSPSSVNKHKVHCSRKANYYMKGWFLRVCILMYQLQADIITKRGRKDIYTYTYIYIYMYIYIYICICIYIVKQLYSNFLKKELTARSPSSHSWSHPRASHQPRVSESPHQWFMPPHHCKLNKFFPR